MAKNVKHIQHVKSSVVENGRPKLPSASTIVEGEIAVNYADGYETISLKTSSGNIVTFSSDNYYTLQKLGSGFTGENSGRTVTGVIEEDERVTSAALNALNRDKTDLSAFTEHANDATIHMTASEKGVLSSITQSDIDNWNSKADSGHVHVSSAVTAMTGYVAGSASGQVESTDTLNEAIAKLNSRTAAAFDKIGSGFSESSITDVIRDDEEVIALALQDLDERKLDASAYTPTDLSNYYTKDETSGATEISTALNEKQDVSGMTAYTLVADFEEKLGSGFTGENSGVTVTEYLEENEEITSAALNDLEERKLDATAYTPTDLSNYYTKSQTSAATEISTALNAYADSVNYNSTARTVEFYHGTTAGTKVFEFDASAFVIDGMVDNVEVDDVTSGSSTVKCLVISFNTDAGKQDINIPISDIFNPDIYYTKDEIDDNELVIASAINDLESRKLDASAYTPTDLSNYYTKDETSGASEIAEALSAKADTTWVENKERAVAAALVDLNDRKADASGVTDLTQSVNTIRGDVNTLVGQNEVIAAALVDLDDRKIDASDLSDYYNKTDIDNRLGSGITTANTVTKVIEENEVAIAAAIAELDDEKQDVLVSGENIKTINQQSLLGSGDIVIESGFKKVVNPNDSTKVGVVNATLASYNSNIGQYSVIEGNNCVASGEGSHAEGDETIASGDYSHAEGETTTASSEASHAEGSGTKAIGVCSHAEGIATIASGDSSHAEGSGTTTLNQSEHASGQYNISSLASDTFGNKLNTLFSVGNGTSNVEKKNAFEIKQNGDMYITSYGATIKLQDYITLLNDRISRLADRVEQLEDIEGAKKTTLTAKFNVTDTSNPTIIINNYAMDEFDSIEIDGVAQSSVESTYTFSTTGEHTVKYITTDPLETIPSRTFSGCTALTNVEIPNTVTSIGDNAFNSCSGLTSVTIPDSVISIGNYAFRSCSGLTNVTIPESITSINYGVFYNCSSLTSVTIPNTVTSISDYAFQNCDLKVIDIPASVTSLTTDSFSGMKPEVVIIDPNNPVYDSRGGCNAIIETESNTLKKGFGCSTIPYGVETIGRYAFTSSSDLTSIYIPDSVTLIDNYAFNSCSGLTSVTIPDSVTRVGALAFYNCSSLTEINIPEDLNDIDALAFSNTPWYTSYSADTNNRYNNIIYINKVAYKPVTSGVTSFTFRSDTVSIAGSFISQATNLRNLYFNEGLERIGSTAFVDCWNIRSLSFPNSLKYIGGGAFQNLSHYLTSVTIPSGVTNIEYSTFRACSLLTAVTIQGDVTSIGDSAFGGCSSLTAFTIPSSVTTIGASAFTSCRKLENITIPSAVESIGESAFSECYFASSKFINNSSLDEVANNYWGATIVDSDTNGFLVKNNVLIKYRGTATNITIPNTVTSIGQEAFRSMYGITSVTITSNVTSIGNNAFYNCTGLTSVTIPNGTIGQYAFQYCYGLTSLTIGTGVTTIGNYAFNGCSGLTSVTIPDSVTSVGTYAFEACSSLTSVTIGTGLTSIGNYAFRSCSSLQTITSLRTTAPSVSARTFQDVKTGGTLYVPTGANYNTWMGTGNYYLGKYSWTKVEQ